ncbi:sensor histidine kinase [Ornithinimicrobium avium]|nr:histidine kinase [Ornithinimicrobium avium]
MIAATAASALAGVVAAWELLVAVLALVRDPLEALFFAAVLGVGCALLVLGGLLTRRLPELPFGPLVTAAGAVLMALHLLPERQASALEGTWMLLYLPLALMLVWFPSGRAATAGWRWAARSTTGVVVLFNAVCVVAAVAPGLRPVLEPPGLVLVLAFLVMLGWCCAAPLARYRCAPSTQRLRLRWMFVAGLALPGTLLLCWASYLMFGAPDLVVIGLLVSYVIIPVGGAVGLLRPRLFDVDRAVVAATTATVLAAAALCVVAAAVWAVGLRLTEWSTFGAVGAVAVLTAGAAIAYPGLRGRLEEVLYPERARALRAVLALTAGVEAGTARPEDLQPELRTALNDPGLVVAHRGWTDPTLLRLDGTPAEPTAATGILRLGGEQIGAIVPSGAGARQVPAAVCKASAPLVASIRSRAEISRALAEVELAQERMLLAGERERHRLERDLHDGAQQRLVALGMRLRVLQRAGTTSPAQSEELDVVVAELATAVAELRQVAHGVRPSILDAGLPAALAELARRDPERITVDAGTDMVPAEVALTAYFVVNEAVTNALRHAAAERIHVTLHQEGSAVVVSVTDDGLGGARVRRPGGLAGLEERVTASGGRFRVASGAGRGTTVQAVLPCGS